VKTVEAYVAVAAPDEVPFLLFRISIDYFLLLLYLWMDIPAAGLLQLPQVSSKWRAKRRRAQCSMSPIDI
jgi:hypothetical protein